MSIRRRTATSVAAGATTVDIDHSNDSIRLGNGIDLLDLVDESGIISIPVSVRNTVTVSNSAVTDGTQRTKITDGTNDAGLTLVGAKYAVDVNVVQTVGGGGGSGGGTSSTDSAVYTPASSAFTPIGGAVDDTSSDALAEGEMGIARLTTARSLHTHITNTVPVSGTFWQATQPVSAASLPLPSGAATQTTLASVLTSMQLLDDMIATLGSAIPSKAGLMAGSDGTLARAVKVDADGHPQIDVLSMPSVSVSSLPNVTIGAALPAGTNNIGDVDVLSLPNVTIGSMPNVTIGSALPTGTNSIGNIGSVGSITNAVTVNTHGVSQSGTWTVNSVGNVAHDAVDSGNPVKVGGVARQSMPANVGVGDRADLSLDMKGRVIVYPYVPRIDVVHGRVTLTTTTETTVLSAQGAGVFCDLTQIVLSNSSNITTNVTIRDASTGTARLIVPIGGYGGAVITLSNPLPQTVANNAWTVQLSAAVSSMEVFFMGIKAT